MVAVVWRFEVSPDHIAEFERFYGANGDWTKMSRRNRSFLGSSFLKDIVEPTRYVLIEYWSEMLVYEKHLANADKEVKELERRRAQFVRHFEPRGVFTALDVPDRTGPTWSRRSAK
jgi:quinol monooxygenase YgiN